MRCWSVGPFNFAAGPRSTAYRHRKRILAELTSQLHDGGLTSSGVASRLR
jgi:hypothetical protein